MVKLAEARRAGTTGRRDVPALRAFVWFYLTPNPDLTVGATTYRPSGPDNCATTASSLSSASSMSSIFIAAQKPWWQGAPP